jgi:hypothetical protein
MRTSASKTDKIKELVNKKKVGKGKKKRKIVTASTTAHTENARGHRSGAVCFHTDTLPY